MLNPNHGHSLCPASTHAAVLHCFVRYFQAPSRSTAARVAVASCLHSVSPALLYSPADTLKLLRT